MVRANVQRIHEIGRVEKLRTAIPIFYVLEVGGGLNERAVRRKSVVPEGILSHPFQAVFKGLSH